MFKIHSFIYALICPFIIHALPSSPSRFTGMVVHDSRAVVPSGFVSMGPTALEKSIELRIAMAPNDIPGLEKRLYAVSTPGNPEYGRHLSKEEVESFVRPSTSTVSKVNAWLDSHSLASSAKTVSPAGDLISLTVPISKANKLFKTTFMTFKNIQSGGQSIQAMEYSVPAELKNDINTVEPTTSFPTFLGYRPTLRALFSSKGDNGNFTQYDGSATCDQQVTPSCLQQQYGIPTARALNPGNRIAVPGFLNEYANNADLDFFLAKFRPDINPRPTFDVELVDGGQNPQDPNTGGIEANLDIQYTVGIATGVPITFVSSGQSTITGFIDVANFLLNRQTPPPVVSVSYGFNENQVSKNSATTLCNIFMQFGVRGSSVIVASGDGGVAGSRPDSCTSFVPTFPATCPFVTSVGATAGTNEIGAGLSAGGFSNYFSQSSYQSAVVSSYLTKLGSNYQGKFNATGRAYPDVSAQGQNLIIAYRGGGALVDGTSASAPIFASVIALLNDKRLGAEKSPLGFLNPFLYSAAGQAALNDVTSGSNPGCSTSGFPAKSGWDPVTGLGTPNYAKLKDAVA